jgi:uncharacterized protein
MMNVVGALSTKECLTLLGGASVGRLVFTEHALPAVRPVAFTVDNGHLVLRASPSEAFRSLDRQIVALEIDSIDPVTQGGWHVVVVGKVRKSADEDGIPTFRLPLDHISGDRFGTAVAAA